MVNLVHRRLINDFYSNAQHKLSVPYPEIIFKKIEKLMFFSKIQRQITFSQKMSFWTKTQRQIKIYRFENFEILCYDLSVFHKIAKNECFFVSLCWDFVFVKWPKNTLLIIRILMKMTKNDIFCQYFSTKNHFFDIFFNFVCPKFCFSNIRSILFHDFFQFLFIVLWGRGNLFFQIPKTPLFDSRFSKKDNMGSSYCIAKHSTDICFHFASFWEHLYSFNFLK